MMKGIAVTFVVLSLAGFAAAAPVYNMQVVADNGTGEWWLYAWDAHYPTTVDNYGIGTFGAYLTPISTVENMAPAAWYAFGAMSGDTAGFVSNRAANASGDPTVAASQDYPAGTATLVYYFGQLAGDMEDYAKGAPFVDTFVPADGNYDAKLLLAKGTYDTSGSAPSIDNSAMAVFSTTTTDTVVSPTLTVLDTEIIPEPATLGLLTSGGLIALLRRRRR